MPPASSVRARPMQHSHEALDRPGGFSRVNLLTPLRHRDFRLLWAGMTVSLVGDGIFLVAMAWQAYELWNAPAALSLSGMLTFWELTVIVALYGVGTAFFTPAFEAIVPDVVPARDLAAANSLDQLVRPIAYRLAGPALGGALVAGFGLGTAFAVDAATFIVSASAVFLMRPP